MSTVTTPHRRHPAVHPLHPSNGPRARYELADAVRWLLQTGDADRLTHVLFCQQMDAARTNTLPEHPRRVRIAHLMGAQADRAVPQARGAIEPLNR